MKFKSLMKYKDFIQSLVEAPQRIRNNAPFEELSYKMLSNKSKRMTDDFDLVKKNWFTSKEDSFDLYVSQTHKYFILGRFYKATETEERFGTIFELTFKMVPNFRSSQKQFNKEVIVIETVHTAEDYRKNKIAQTFYEEILSNYIVISDQLQYEGAVNLWKKLIENNKVYTYDIIDDKIISKVTPNTPESHIWSDTKSKRRIRLVMFN